MLKPVQKQLEEVKVVLRQLKLTGEDPAGAKNEEKRLLNEFYILSARAKARDGPMRIFAELGPLLLHLRHEFAASFSLHEARELSYRTGQGRAGIRLGLAGE